MMGFSIRAAFHAGRAIGRLLATSVIVLTCAATAPLAQGPPGPDPVYDATGFQPNRDYYSPLPFESLDTVSGNLLLTFTDLALPGNAGFSLAFTRSYNSKNGGRWRFGLAGLPLVVRSTAPAWIQGSDPTAYVMPTFQTSDLADHVTRWTPEPGNYGNGDVVLTSEFWRYTVSARRLEFPNGLVAVYDHLVARTGGGYDGFLTSVTDPFTNSLTLTWADGRLAEVRQNLASGQERVVTFSYRPGSRTLPLLAFPSEMHLCDPYPTCSRTWRYFFGSEDPLIEDLTEARPPIGASWYYGGAPFTVTTPHGGKVKYSYALFQMLSGKKSERENTPLYKNVTMLSERTTEDKDASGNYLVTGTWNFTWVDISTYQARLTIVGPVRTIKYGCAWLESGPVPDVRTVESLGQVLETETLHYHEIDVWHPAVSIYDSKFPLLDQRTVVRGGKTYETSYSYSLDNFADYAHPNAVTEAGDLSRTTTIAYQHAFTPYIRARVSSAMVTVGGESRTRSYEYNQQTGFVASRTVYNVTTNYAPDPRGNVANVTDANGNTTTFSYSMGVPKDVWTPEYPGPTITRTINMDGTVETETRRGFETLFGYDDNGRPISVRPHPGFGDTTFTTYDNSSTGMRWTTVARGSVSATTTLDGFGRPIATEDSAGVKTRTVYDAEGRKTYLSYPFEGANDTGDTFEYDPLNRVTKVTHPGNSYVAVSYPNGDTEIVDEIAHGGSTQRKTVQGWRAFGDPSDARLMSLTDPAGNVWNYTYTALGALTGVAPPANAPGRVWSYDNKHRLEYDIQPESGRTDYVYDNAGRLSLKTDARGIEIAFTYDANNRLKKIEGPNEVVDIWYDESNNRTRVRNGLVDSTFTYDGSNRPTGRSDILGGQTFAAAYQYDGRDILTGIDYPSGRHVTYTPNAHGRITSVTGSGGVTYASNVQYHPSGAISGLTFGNAATESVTFDNRQRPDWLRSGPLDIFYQYDDVGNVLSIDDARGFDFDSSFFYEDKLDRLTRISGFGTRTYTYDALGNRRAKVDGTGTVTYSYDEAKQRLSSIDDWPYNGALTYDPAGNLTVDPVGAYTYTPFNLMATATVGTAVTAYGYDGDNMRVRKVTPEGTKFYIHGAGSQLLAEYDEAADGVELVREYIYLGSKLLASASRNAAPAPVGRVTGVSPAPLSAAAGTSVAVTVTGATQSCSSVQVDFGDGTVTTYSVPSQTLPLVVSHTYTAAGIYTVIARGQSPCLGTISAPLEVTSGNVVDNGDFSQVDGNGIPIGWGIYTQGGQGYWNATSGVFNFYRTEGMSQAVTLQYTGLALPTGAPLELTFRMGNSDTVRKRLTVMIHTPGFDDLALCTFWLDPQQPLNDYVMRTHTTKAWADATVSFYAADVNAPGSTGAYQLDDVALNYRPALSSAKTDCVDPNRPTSGGIAADGFISNGDFAVWPSSSWTVSGQLTYQVANEVLEFFRSGSPPLLIAQSTGTTMDQDQRMAAVFELGNTSGIRQRVTVTLQSTTATASDFTSCIFWLAPGTPRQFYAMTTYATQAWANATITVAPAVNGTSPTFEWLQLDTVSLAKITDPILGTECFEPGSFTLGGGGTPVPAPEPAPLHAAAAVATPLMAVTSDLGPTFSLEPDVDDGPRAEGPRTPPAVALALSIAGSGSGTVTSSPAGINCGGQGVTCTGWFVESTTVTLTAVPDAGTTFAGWFGACEGTSTCVVSMVGTKTVTALFSGPLTMNFYHLDALGSVRAVTDSSTPYVVLKRHDYFAFGEDPAPMTGDPRRFTGKELDAETALQYFGGRYYRSGIGAFTTVDPVFASDETGRDPQRWNRYAYSKNNPYRFLDPDGRKIALSQSLGRGDAKWLFKALVEVARRPSGRAMLEKLVSSSTTFVFTVGSVGNSVERQWAARRAKPGEKVEMAFGKTEPLDTNGNLKSTMDRRILSEFALQFKLDSEGVTTTLHETRHDVDLMNGMSWMDAGSDANEAAVEEWAKKTKDQRRTAESEAKMFILLSVGAFRIYI